MGKISKTLLGKDDELRTPEHDKMMIWLNDAIDIFLAKWINIKREWNINEISVEFGIDKSKFDMTTLPDKPNIKIVSKDWEDPITRGTSKTLVGVPDMIVRYKRPSFYVLKDGRTGIDFIDCSAGFEVKPAISSLGEVVRQINIYREYSSASRWFLMSKKTNSEFLRILKEQRIHFIEYDGKQVQDEYIDGQGRTCKIPVSGLENHLGIDIKLG